MENEGLLLRVGECSGNQSVSSAPAVPEIRFWVPDLTGLEVTLELSKQNES